MGESLSMKYQISKVGPWGTLGHGVQFRIESEPGLTRLILMYTNIGLDGARDWFHNFLILLSITPFGGAHLGFRLLWESASYEIVARVLAALGDGRLEILGISQGAALAERAHDAFARILGRERVSTYAFACPGSWWRFFLGSQVIERAETLTTINRRGDIVALILLVLGYRHVGTVVKIGAPAFPWWTHHRFEEYEEALNVAE